MQSHFQRLRQNYEELYKDALVVPDLTLTHANTHVTHSYKYIHTHQHISPLHHSTKKTKPKKKNLNAQLCPRQFNLSQNEGINKGHKMLLYKRKNRYLYNCTSHLYSIKTGSMVGREKSPEIRQILALAPLSLQHMRQSLLA